MAARRAHARDGVDRPHRAAVGRRDAARAAAAQRWFACLVARLSHDGRLVAAGCGDGTVRLLDAATLEERQVLRGHESGVRAVAFSPCSRYVVSSGDQLILMHDAATGTEIVSMEGHGARVLSVAWFPDGRAVVSASDDRTARVWTLVE